MSRPALALVMLAALAAVASASLNVSLSLPTGGYFNEQISFSVIVNTINNETDLSNAACNPDCRYITISGVSAESRAPFTPAALITNMKATLRGVACQMITSPWLLQCPYFAGPFTAVPVVIPGTFSIEPFRGAAGYGPAPLDLTFSVTTLAIDRTVQVPTIRYSILGYKESVYNFEPIVLQPTLVASWIEHTITGVTTVGFLLSFAVLIATIYVLFIYRHYNLKNMFSKK